MKIKFRINGQFKTNIIERYKNGESSYKISKNEECSYNTILRALKKNGIDTGQRYWIKEEIEKLKKFYPISSEEELFKEFPNRKIGAIMVIANKLGLKKKECKKICKDCKKEFVIKTRTKYGYKKGFCLKCIKRQWEQNNRGNAIERQKKWLQNNPEYLKQYMRRPEVKRRISEYTKQLRKKSPKYHLDCNMGTAIYMALKDKKRGRRWESLVGYTLKELMGHLESKFDENMAWDNYGSYWQIDHIKPRSLFKYIYPEDLEFKKCWSLNNLQPLEKIANLKKSDTFIS